MARTKAQALAVCANRHFYPAYEFWAGAPGVEVLEATFTMGEDVSVPDCPECGETGRALAGTYDFAENTVKLLQGPERTVSELERLREILREARTGGANPEEVRSAVEREFPEWGRTLAGLLVPKTPGELYGLLSLVVAIIGVLLAYEQSEQAKDAKPDEIINNITVVEEAAPVPGQVTSPAAGSMNPAYGERTGRNEPCPCGSGQKFKKCHGKNGEKRYQGP